MRSYEKQLKDQNDFFKLLDIKLKQQTIKIVLITLAINIIIPILTIALLFTL